VRASVSPTRLIYLGSFSGTPEICPGAYRLQQDRERLRAQ
jgi:hypothetical protein